MEKAIKYNDILTNSIILQNIVDITEILMQLMAEGYTIKKEDVGRFSVGSNVGVPINVVSESVSGGQRKFFIVFERWMRFGELRGGYRSVDYPFGVIEMTVDERTGKGEGTYIAAAQIRWKKDKKSGQYQVEVENFATYPAKLMGVSRRGGKS